MNQLVGIKKNGVKFLALVLEPGNLHRLQKREPITVRVEDLFPDGIPRQLEVAIFYSETPIADARYLAKMAEVAFDERAAVIESKRPHCPECRSTIEQLGMMRGDAPVHTIFCPVCGCVLGVTPNKP